MIRKTTIIILTMIMAAGMLICFGACSSGSGAEKNTSSQETSTEEVTTADEEATSSIPSEENRGEDPSQGSTKPSNNDSPSGSDNTQSTTKPTSQSNSGDIGAARAKAIALSRVPGATERNIVKFQRTRDDGYLIYEGEIYYNHTEYEFEIDGVNGNILDWEVERDDYDDDDD